MCIALRGSPSQSYELYGSSGCHLPRGSHHVICHPTQVNTQAGTRFAYPRGIEGWVDLGGRVHTKMVYLSTLVTHPSIVTGPVYSNFADWNQLLHRDQATMINWNKRKCCWILTSVDRAIGSTSCSVITSISITQSSAKNIRLTSCRRRCVERNWNITDRQTWRAQGRLRQITCT